jgi:CubicO group peptidase (beta-lactamase class C family)
MKETGFRADLARRVADETRFAPVNPRFAQDPAVSGSQYFSGAAGVWGTLADYARFAEMLAQGGTYAGHRILKPASVTMMHTDQVGGLYHGNGKAPKDGLAFGLTMEIVRDAQAADVSAPNESYGWEGAGGTHFWVMPEQHAVVVMYAPNPKFQAEVERTVTMALTSK